MNLESFPSLPWSRLFARDRGEAWTGWFGPRENLRLLHLSRVALYHGAKALGLGPGCEVLVPSYHCGAEVDALRYAGATVRFYRIGDDLRVDLDDLAARVTSETKGVLVIHFYGFRQDLAALREFCDRRGLALLEDAAHVLPVAASGERSALAGDLTIYSLQKFLPVPDGGILVRRGPAPALEVIPPERLPMARQIALLVLGRLRTRRPSLYRLVNRLLLDPIRALRGSRAGSSTDPLAALDPGSSAFHPAATRYGMSATTRRLCSSTDFAQVVARRRANYQTLLDALRGGAGVAPCFDALPPDVCPMLLPVRTGRRDRVAERLRERGITPFVFGGHLDAALDPARFPEASALSRDVLGLPVHQDLGAEDMLRIAACVREAAAGGGAGTA